MQFGAVIVVISFSLSLGWNHGKFNFGVTYNEF